MHVGRQGRRAALLALPLLLGGCAFFEALLSALGLAADQPRIAYLEDPSGFGPTQTLSIGAIQPDDRVLVIREITDFGADGSIEGMGLSPEEQFVAVTHVEDSGFVIEPRVQVYRISDGVRAGFETDNTVSSEFDTLCGANADILAEFEDDIPTFIGNGSLPPDTSGALIVYFDDPNNVIEFNRWIADDELIIRGSVEVELTYLAPSGDVPIGPGQSVEFFMTYAEDPAGDWEVTSCLAALPGGLPTFPLTRDVALGAAAPEGQIIELDGAAILNAVGGQPIAPDGARRVDGPYR